MYGTANKFGKLLATLILISECAAQASAIPASLEYQQFTLVGCPSPVKVAVPKEFRRAPSVEVLESKKACRYTWDLKGSYECLFQDWSPDVTLPRVEVTAWTDFAPRYTPGELDKSTWRSIRASIGGRSSDTRDRRIMELIRRFEPSAPGEESALRERYAEFFHDSWDTAPRIFSGTGARGSYLIGGRYFYVHRCIISIQFYVPYPSEQPMTTLNNYMRRMGVQ